MRVTYKGRRNYGSSFVEIDFDKKEIDKVKALVSIMNAKGWKWMKLNTININGMETSWVCCPVEDSSTFKECFMQDWKEAKIELKNKEKNK